MTDETMQDIDSETVKEIFPAEYATLQGWIKEGRNMKSIDKEINNWFPGWHWRVHYQNVCQNAARSMERRKRADELAEARAALDKAGDK